MYEYIKGTLIEATPTRAVVDVNGLGYSLLIPFNHYLKLPALGSTVLLYTSFVVREDAHRLFGFLTQGERELFESLTDVSGIGPKTAVALIGHMEIQELQTAISQGNTSRICKIPGIGKKTAERLVIEMRDKIKKIGGSLLPSATSSQEKAEEGVITDAISALINLGYNGAQAQKAIDKVLEKNEKDPSLAMLITSALRVI